MNTTNTISSTQTAIDFPVWTTIKVGCGPYAPKDFLSSLVEKVFHTRACVAAGYIGSWKTLKRMRHEEECSSVDLVCIGMKQLIPDSQEEFTDLRTIKGVALSKGLELCPEEAAAQIILQQYTTPPQQSSADFVKIVSKPIMTEEGDLRCFSLAYKAALQQGVRDERHLVNGWSVLKDWESYPDTKVHITNWLIFVKPRKRERQ